MFLNWSFERNMEEQRGIVHEIMWTQLLMTIGGIMLLAIAFVTFDGPDRSIKSQNEVALIFQQFHDMYTISMLKCVVMREEMHCFFLPVTPVPSLLCHSLLQFPLGFTVFSYIFPTYFLFP